MGEENEEWEGVGEDSRYNKSAAILEDPASETDSTSEITSPLVSFPSSPHHGCGQTRDSQTRFVSLKGIWTPALRPRSERKRGREKAESGSSTPSNTANERRG